jgi:hypothetical protein
MNCEGVAVPVPCSEPPRSTPRADARPVAPGPVGPAALERGAIIEPLPKRLAKLPMPDATGVTGMLRPGFSAMGEATSDTGPAAPWPPVPMGDAISVLPPVWMAGACETFCWRAACAMLLGPPRLTALASSAPPPGSTVPAPAPVRG